MLDAIEGGRAIPRWRPPHMTGAGLWARPDRRQQRRDAVRRAGDRRARRRVVRRPRPQRRGRHQDGHRRRPRATARVVRAAHGHAHARGHRASTPAACSPGTHAARRRARRRLDVVRAGDGHRRAARLRLAREGGQPAGHGDHGRRRRHHLLVDLLANLELFFAQESCGWCTPCRDGLPWTLRLLRAIEEGRGAARRHRAPRGARVDDGPGARPSATTPRAPCSRCTAASCTSATSSSVTSASTAARYKRGGPQRRRSRRSGGDAVSESLVTVTIDGRSFQVTEGRNMLEVSLSLGFDLPYFCWHPAMGSVGACRQCAVKQYWTGRDGHEHEEVVMACMTPAEDGTRIAIDEPEAIAFRTRDDRAADDQPPPRLPGLRRGRRVPPAGHDGDDRPQLPPLPLRQAHLRQPGSRAVRHARAQPLHRLLPLRALLQRLRRRPRLRRLQHRQPRLLRPPRERHARERVQRQPGRGLPHRRLHRQDAGDALHAQVGPADGARHLPALRHGLQSDRRRALRRAAPRAGALQPRHQRRLHLRPRPLRLRVRQRRRPAAAARGEAGRRVRGRPDGGTRERMPWREGGAAAGGAARLSVGRAASLGAAIG